MKLTLKLNLVLPIIRGTGKNGTWKKQELVFETNDRFPKNLCMMVWGDKINTSDLIIGNQYAVDFEIESREYRERWYTELRLTNLIPGDRKGTGENGSNHFNENDGEDVWPF